jgi:hypothetical protein
LSGTTAWIHHVGSGGRSDSWQPQENAGVCPQCPRQADGHEIGRRGRRPVRAHGFPLPQSELDWIEQALHTFYRNGPDIHFWSSRPGPPDAVRPSYRQLMTAIDLSGQERSFL